MKAGKELVLYYAPEKTDTDRVIKSVLARQGVRIRNIDPDTIGQSVGFLAGVPGAAMEAAESAKRDDIPEKLLVFCGFGRSRLDRVLREFRARAVPQDILKAALTISNSTWSLARLYEEISAERERMSESEPD